LRSRRTLRNLIIGILQDGDFAALTALAAEEPRVGEILLQFLYDPEDLLQWRALEGLGCVAAAYPEQVQKLISRLLWLLNEDSGSFGWGAAAALGEIGRGNITLVKEIIPMFCGFLEEDFSRAPMLWGIGRLAEVRPEQLNEVLPVIVTFLTSTDPQVRALTAWALGKAGFGGVAGDLQALSGDERPVAIYDRGELRHLTVAQVAREALAALKGRETGKTG
jgi:HEAT repeat protein